jgi:hypothetical protein
MIHASYDIWGVAVAALLLGFWIIKRCVFRKIAGTGSGLGRAACHSSSSNHEIEHQALMFLMAQKTDSVLAALAHTIDLERQKLGGVVRKPSMTNATKAWQAAGTPVPTGGQSSYDRIVPMARDGLAVATIARQLQLPEAEVSMVMRLNAA